MAHINLLPWREELRQEQTRQFATVTILSMALTAGAILLVHIAFNNQIEHHAFRNSILQNEIKTLDDSLKQIADLESKKEQLLARMNIIQSLQQQRPQIVHLFDDFVRTVPEGIYLTKIIQLDKSLTLNGVAESNGRVSAYMRAIDRSEWMSTPKLKVIETKKGSLRSSKFIIETSQSIPDKDSIKEKAGEES